MKICSFLIALSLLTCIALAQDETSSDFDLTVYAGATVYTNPAYDSVGVIDFNFSLTRNQFEFYRPDSTDPRFYSRIYAQVMLINSRGQMVDSASTYFSIRVNDMREAALSDIRLFNKLSLMAEPSVYSARVTVIDVVSKREGEAFIQTIVVEPPEKKKLSLSELALAFNIVRIDDTIYTESRMARNGFYITPNPVGVYSVNDSLMFIYGEIYNLSFDSTTIDTGLVRLSFQVIDEHDNLFQSFGQREIRIPGTTAGYAEKLDIKHWPRGLFRLRIVAEELKTKAVDTMYHVFRIIAPSEVVALAERQVNPDPFDEISTENKIKISYSVMTPDYRATIKTLSDIGKENFLFQFWRDRDPDPTTLMNETRLALVERYHHANQVYSSNEAKDNGWTSDRGRIFIVYGIYDRMEESVAPIGRQAYQVWYYDTIKEGKLFVFEDWLDAFDYRLVHSNVYGEIFNADWDKIVRGIDNSSLHTDPDNIDSDL